MSLKRYVRPGQALLAAWMVSIFPPAWSESLTEASVGDIRMFAGDMQVVEGAGFTDVAVGNSSVVSAASLPGRGILVTAREPGETTVRVWRGGLQQVLYVRVYPENLQRLQAELRGLLSAIPGASVSLAGGNVVVDAGPLSTGDRQRLARILAAYPSVINLVQEPQPGRQQMIYMDVRILELSRNGISRLGVDWADDMAGPVYAAAGDVHKSMAFQKGVLQDATGVAAMPRMSPFQSYFGMATRLDSRINLLEQSGDAMMVAHPILSCRNEGKASFLSGGQVPFASASATGTPSVEFKDYGIKLDIEPVLGEKDSLFARIAAEVSDLDKSTTVNNVPGLLTRRTETEFSMKLGETIVLSGLVNKVSGQDENSLPGLGRIPLLGRLFSSQSKAVRRTELVIFVTPRVQDGMRKELEVLSGSGDRMVSEVQQETMLFRHATPKAPESATAPKEDGK